MSPQTRLKLDSRLRGNDDEEGTIPISIICVI
jgi:hypothetical protein